MLRRSKNIVVYVSPDQYEGAVEFYRKAFGLTLEDKEPDIASLKGPNFMLYVEPKKPSGLNLQEFVPLEEMDAKTHLLNLGCKPIEVDGSSDSTDGFYVEDPYGLKYHVYTTDTAID
jgi:hypothetical protein